MIVFNRFMVLDPHQMGYFIEQVGLSAASFGVAQSDVKAVGTALESLFDYRCAPKTTVIPAQGPQFQSICTDKSCPLAQNATCAAQPWMPQPCVANQKLAMGQGRMCSASSSGMPSASASASMSGTSTPAMPSPTYNAAVQSAPGITGLLSALVAFLAL